MILPTLAFSLLFVLDGRYVYGQGGQERIFCRPENPSIIVHEGEEAELKVKCNENVSGTAILTAVCVPFGTKPAKILDDLSPRLLMIEITGIRGSSNIKTSSDDDCSEGSETAVCYLVGSTNSSAIGWGMWSIAINECPCGERWGTGEVCEDLKPKPPGCYKACPDGQIYSTSQSDCFLPRDCPKSSGRGYGDPQYTTFDGVVYFVLHHCSHVSAEDCQHQTWSVYQFTSNTCTRGGRATCIDQVMVRLKRTNTIVHYNYWAKSYKFIGNVPSTDDMIVSSNGYSFTAHLVQEDITVVYGGYYMLTITLGSQWRGPRKVCGLYGTADGNRSNEWTLRDGTVLDSYTDPRFEMEYRADDITGACTEPKPPEPAPPCVGDQLAAATNFCSAMYNSSGSYASCHATIPPGNVFEEPVDTLFEQCVLDHCLADAETACGDILSYADQCQEHGHRVGDPPAICLPTCPGESVYNSCGPLAPPTCDMPEGVDGCVAGCFCPDGTFLFQSNQCVTVCPVPVNFDRPTYYTREENGGICIKIYRKGSSASNYSITLLLSEELSQADARGQPGECCGCSSEPSMCAGSTECEVTFSAKQRQRCVWVKIDNDDSPTDDREVTLSINGGQNEDKAKVHIKDEQDRNCLKFKSRAHRIQESTQTVDIGLALTKNISDVFWAAVTTREETASACFDFQSGRYEACFAVSLTSSVTVPVTKDRETEGFECFSQSIEPLGDGEDYDPPVVPCFPKYSLTIIADNLTNIPAKGNKYKCFNRSNNAEDICRENTDVVRVTILDEAQPEDCYLGYNIEVQHIYKGSLSQGEKTVLRVLPVERCPDPTFDYGVDYLVAGDVVDGNLVVEGEGVVLDCLVHTQLVENLCP